MLHQASNRFNPEDLWKKDRDHFLHPYTHFDSFKEEGSLVLVEGEGCYVKDVEGRRYFDGIGGMWCVNAGYGRKEIAQTMAEQALQLCYTTTFVDVTNAPAAELAAKLASLALLGLNHVAFATSGSCGIDTAIRLAHYYQPRRGESERKYIISRKNSYHGSTYLGMTVGLRDGDQSPHFRYVNDLVHHLSAPYPYRRPDGMSLEEFSDFLVDEFRHKIETLGAHTIAAFIAEPAQASGGVTMPPPTIIWPRMRQLCSENGILFIADEVVTAFGRLGHMFASEAEFGIVPDIIVTAKGLTWGYIPLSAVLYSDEVHEVISAPDADAWFTHGYTYSGHPVACAVALKNIEIIEREDLLGNAARVGDYLETRLAELALYPLSAMRGRRLMMCIEYVGDKDTKKKLPDEVNISKRISNECEAHGLLVRPIGHLDVLSPPLIITRTQVDFIVDTLSGAIRKVTDELVREKALPVIKSPMPWASPA